MCCCPSKCCCMCTLLIVALIGIGLLFGFGIYTRGFHKLTSNVHLQDPYSSSSYGAGAGRSFRAYSHLAPPPSY